MNHEPGAGSRHRWTNQRREEARALCLAEARCHRAGPHAGATALVTLVPELARLTHAAILILSMHDRMVFAERARMNGANGYVMKNERMPVLLTALRRVLDGKTYVSERVSEMLLRSLSGRPPTGRNSRDCPVVEPRA